MEKKEKPFVKPLRLPMYEVNPGVCEFIPSPPKENLALQGQKVPGQEFNGVTIEEMRAAPELYDKSVSGLDKKAVVLNAQRETAEKLKSDFLKNNAALKRAKINVKK